MSAILSKNILIGIGALIAGVLVLLLATSRNGSEPTATEGFILSGNPTTQDVQAPKALNPSGTAPADLIKGFLPQGGTGAACSEDVGVLLAQGYSATLTINGVSLAPEDLNVNLEADGTVSNVITATRSKGQFSFKPGTDCPKGELIRPTNNALTVCVWANSDVSRSCVLTETYRFDAI